MIPPNYAGKQRTSVSLMRFLFPVIIDRNQWPSNLPSDQYPLY